MNIFEGFGMPGEEATILRRERERGPRLTFARWAAAFAAAMGLAVLAGWALDMPTLRSVIPGAVEMKANTAVGLLAGALALRLASHRRRTDPRWPGFVAALAIGLLGAITLAEYGLGWNAGIDELLFRDTAAAFNQARGRMSPFSAFAFVALSCSLISLGRRRLSALTRTASGIVVAIGLVSFLGYLWNVSEIVTDRVAPPVALHTAWAFMLLGLAVYLMAEAPHIGPPLRTRSRLETLMLGGLIPTVLFVLMGGGVIYTTGSDFVETAQLVAHTQEVRAQLGRVHGAIADAELARRNRLLTDDARYTRDAEALEQMTRQNLARVRQMVRDNPAQLALAQRLAELAERRIEALQQIARAVGEGGLPQARPLMLADASEHLMEQVRTVAQQMDQAEVALLETRLLRAQSQRRSTLVALLGTLGLLTVLLLLLFRSIQREVLARGAAESHLQRLNAELEQRVRDRTRQLEHQQTFLRRVIDLNRNLIFAKDREGRFVLVNQSLANAYGTTVEAMVGRSEESFNPNVEQVRQYHAADVQVIDSGQDLVIPEERITTAQGETRWLSTIKRPMLSVDGSATILLGVASDITERKIAEDELRHMATTLERRVHARTVELRETNAQLEQARLDSEAASRAKSAFLANMSHEIRTPMNAIIGLTHLMTRETRDHLQRDRLGKVSSAAQHLLQVINDILDISKIEAGKLTLDDAEFSLDELLLNAAELVAAQGRDKGLEMILEQDHLPSRLRGDPTRLSQILINLLANAVKFTEYGWVKLRGEVLAEEGDRLLMRFEVQDTGPGISAERQAALFNAFEQADNTSSRRHGGTGLGLALSRELARAMGGDAGCDSAPGAGSTFWFTASLGRAAQAPARPLPAALQGLRALVVDDLPEAMIAIGDQLRRLGLVVDAVASGPEAVIKVQTALAAGRAYDVLLIDWRMAPLDGIETQQRLRGVLGEGMPKSILVTAFDDPSLVAQARRVHFDAVMLKPLSSSALHDELVELMRGASSEAPSTRSESSKTAGLLQARHGGQRILLAEDNPVNREIAQELLQLVGLVVETAWDGARAVEMALTRRYDLVLMDIQMPVMDGIQATQAIREQIGAVLPIIAMTANAFSEDRQACLDAGMNDHVAKPVSPELLYTTLLRWLPLREHSTSRPAPLAELPRTAPLQTSLRERLARVDGLNIDMALNHVAGQLPILERALRRFAETYRTGLPELLHAGDSFKEMNARWRKVCHSMRGALTTIGATAVLAELTDLESRLHSTRDTHDSGALAEQGHRVHARLLQLVEQLAAELSASRLE